MLEISIASRCRSLARLIALVCLSSGVAAFVAQPVLAQIAAPTPPPASTPTTPPTKEQLAEAKKFYDAGTKLYKEGLYQEALASFLEANRVSPRESIQRNIAQTYRDMKDMGSAYDAYEVLLAKYGDKMKPNLKNAAQQALEELAVLTGVVTIGVQEPGARVTIDGKDAGPTPLPKPIRVNIGSHAVAITKDGFEPIGQQIEIRGHDTATVNGPLVKTVLTGHVTVAVIQTTPPDPTVKVLIDGKDVGSPPYTGDLDPGAHTIEVKGDTAAATPKQISVEKKGSYGETLELHVQQGVIAVNVDVADSEIAIDGKLIARGVFEGPEPIGTHALTVTKPGYVQYKKDLIVHDADKLVENVALQKEQVAAAVAPPHDWTGVYSQLNFVGQFEVTAPSNDVAQGVGYNTSTAIKGSSIFGAGMNVRVGYSFGIVGIEGSILFGYDHSAASAAVNQSTVTHPGQMPRVEDYDFHRIGGTLGLGVRLMPKTQVVRPTIGVGGGVSLKTAFYNRSIENTSPPSNEATDPAFYVAPAFMADAGIELGSTPGTRFYLGCLMVADFASATQVNAATSFHDPSYPAPSRLNVVNGTDVFIGPILGMQFGE